MGNFWAAKKLSLFLGLIWLALGCRQPAQPSVRFAIFGEPAEFAAYEELIAAFQRGNADIEIALAYIPDQSTYRQRLATEFAAGQPPDVFLLNYRRFAQFTDDDGLQPLGDYLAGSQQIAAADFYPLTLAAFTYQGELFCIPQNLSSLVVYYNKTMFEAAGIPLPQSNWNWDDFLAIAQQLTLDQDGDGVREQHGLGLTPNFFRLAPFVWGNGGAIVDDFDQPTRLTLNEPAAQEAFQWFVELQTKYGVTPNALEETSQPSENRFLNGRLGMYLNSRRGVPTYRTIEAFEWDVAPLPRGEAAAGILHSDGYCMAQATADKEAAWRFIEFANSVAGQTIVAGSGRTVPSLIAVAESEAFLDPEKMPASSGVFLDVLPALQRVPTMANWVGIEEAVGKEVERAYYGTVSVPEAIQAANHLTQEFFDKKK